ncbi:unnamed protein product, partial [Adineta ricciae]
MINFLSTRSGFLRPLISKYSTKAINPSKRQYPSKDSSNEVLRRLNYLDNYERAFQFFDNLVKQNRVTVASLLTILETCTRSGQIQRGRQVEQMVNQSSQWKYHVRVQTALINMFMKFHMIDQAEQIFERIRQLPSCDTIVYNSMLVGYLRNQHVEKCFACVEKMRSRVRPDNVTYTLLLNGKFVQLLSEIRTTEFLACTFLRDKQRGKAIHQELSSNLDSQHVHLQNALIDFYGKINEITVAENIFHEMTLRETSTYNSLMKAYLINRMAVKVLELFEQMKEDNLDTVGPIGFRPDLITFMAVCDACEQLGLLNSPDKTQQLVLTLYFVFQIDTYQYSMGEIERPRLFYDPNSLSSFNRFRIVHTHFDLTVNFDSHVLDGFVQLDIQPLDNQSCDRSSSITTENHEIPNNHGNILVLDSRHLDIKQVMLKSDSTEKVLPFQIDIERESLVIELNDLQLDSNFSIKIAYATSSTKCTALQWLTKEQTADKQYPYMFSQCQAIHARSLYPCQDTPGVKSTYSAKITCPKPLTVLMSGLQSKHDEATNTFYFEQKQPIASYLIAIAVGNLVSHDLSSRIRVWTEPSMIKQCQYEFEESERFLTAAEELLGKYQWQRYDFLVLPPSFPYGGMENPCMNFLTPTLLAGDRSLISTIVHEMTHSWT